jgi:hypothetical protein
VDDFHGPYPDLLIGPSFRLPPISHEVCMSQLSRRQVIGGAGSALLIGGTGVAHAAPNTATSLTADVCIVGAGFAGLAAALRLKQAGASVVVLEASSRMGGRSSTVRLKDGGWVDWGGQWVGSSQDRFYALIKEMGGETYPSPNFGKTLQRGVLDTRCPRAGDAALAARHGDQGVNGLQRSILARRRAQRYVL